MTRLPVTHPVLTRLHPALTRLHPVLPRLHPVLPRSHPVLTRSHPVLTLTSAHAPTHTRPQACCRSWIPNFHSKSGLLFLFILWAILIPSILPAQSEPGPEPTSAPQLLLMGHCLESLRSDVLLPHFQNKNRIAQLQFRRTFAGASSDIYIGSVSLDRPTTGATGGVSWGAIGPFSLAPTEIRFCYLKSNSSTLPDPWIDAFYYQLSPITSVSRRLPTVLDSVTQVDWLLQICRWMDPQITPQALIPFRSWLDDPQTRITAVKGWQNQNRVGLTLTGRAESATGPPQPWRIEISGIPLPGGAFTEVEVRP